MTSSPPAHDRSLLVHYGELGLKGKNQPQFRARLRDNLRRKLRALGCECQVHDRGGLLDILIGPDQDEAAVQSMLEAVRQVFGVAWFSEAIRVPHRRFRPETVASDRAAVEKCLLQSAVRQFIPGQTFCVRVRRGDKKLPFTSLELERDLGGLILRETPWKKVSVSNPDLTFHVDLRQDAAFLHSAKFKGPGGLPVGGAGRVLVLLSGGIDSPVAAYLMAKRGCHVDFIHFTASSMTPEEAREYKVWKLAQHLSQFTMSSRLVLVPYTHFDLALMREPVDYDLILFRRFVARVAQQLARRLRAQALVTGDNLSQVASQTLSNLVSTSRAVELPILRPLVGFDKEEIIEVAKKIGSYQTSIEPYKDCCALISRHPRTSSDHERLLRLEGRVFPDQAKLIEDTLAEAVCVNFAFGRPENR